MIGSAIIATLISKEFLLVSGVSVVTCVSTLVHRKLTEQEHCGLSRLVYIVTLLFLLGFTVKSIVDIFSTIETIFFM